MVQDRGNKTINEALRREVLAYTTDGISQSVEKAASAAGGLRLMDCHYPEHIKDFQMNVITRFNGLFVVYCHVLYIFEYQNDNIVSIEKNTALVGRSSRIRKHSRRMLCRCCCIASVRNRDIQDSLTTPVLTSVRKMSIIEEDSDELHGGQREFVDYAPVVFRYIRNEIMGIKDHEYIQSITPLNPKEQYRALKGCKVCCNI